MKKVLFAIGLMAAMVAVSCNKQLSTEVSEEPEYYEVKLGMSGAITTEISDLTKAGSDIDQLIGINVWRCPEGGTTYTHYAYGLFDINDITITLQSNCKFKFEVITAFDNKSLLITSDNKYGGPFSRTTLAYDSGPTSLNNQFVLSDNSYFPVGNSHDYFPVDLYYGEVSDYTPKKNSSVTVEMKRVSFGLKIVAQNVPDNNCIIFDAGSGIHDHMDAIVLSQTNPVHYKLYAMSNYHPAYNPAGYVNVIDGEFFQNIEFNVIMLDGEGSLVKDYGSTIVKVMRNKLITIKINAAADTDVNNSFSLDYIDGIFRDEGSDDNTYEIGGEEIVTPIEGV